MAGHIPNHHTDRQCFSSRIWGRSLKIKHASSSAKSLIWPLLSPLTWEYSLCFCTVKWIYPFFLPKFCQKKKEKEKKVPPPLSWRDSISEYFTIRQFWGVTFMAFMVYGAWQSQRTPGNSLCADMWEVCLGQTGVWEEEWRLTSGASQRQKKKKKEQPTLHLWMIMRFTDYNNIVDL